MVSVLVLVSGRYAEGCTYLVRASVSYANKVTQERELAVFFVSHLSWWG